MDNIQPLTDEDIPVLLAIEQTSAAPWSEAAFKKCREVQYPGWSLRDETGVIIGFILISIAAGECHVLNLCIRPDWQRKGMGKQLLVYALRWAKQKGAGIVYLEVRRSNEAAIGLYRQMNFKQIGERKNYYPHTPKGPEDAIVFARDLGVDE